MSSGGVLLCLLCTFLATAATDAPESQDSGLDQLLPSVVCLVAKPTAPCDRAENTCATGLLVRSGTDSFLVTARHAADLLGESAGVVVSLEDGRSDTMSLQAFAGTSQTLEWHRSSSADVAALRLAPSTARAQHPLLFITAAMVWNDIMPPSRQEPVVILGFPLGLGTDFYFSPISRQTHIAGGPVRLKQRTSGRPSEFFLLEDPSIGGYSGAPVFIGTRPYYDGIGPRAAAGRPTCVGIVQGVVSDSTGGKLTAVVPGLRIRELLRSVKGQ